MLHPLNPLVPDARSFFILFICLSLFCLYVDKQVSLHNKLIEAI